MKKILHPIPILFIIITVYFVYHGSYGNRGLLRLNQIREERIQEEKVAAAVLAEKELLQKKVNALKNGAPDLVQEEALRVLNMGSEDDLIVLENLSE